MLYFLLRLAFKLGVLLPCHGAGREGFFPLPFQITVVSQVWRYLVQLVLRGCSQLFAGEMHHCSIYFVSGIFSCFPNDHHFFTLKPLPLFVRVYVPQCSILYARVLSPV